MVPLKDGEAGVDLMFPAREEGQHPPGVGLVRGLAQDRSVQYHHRIGGDDKGIGGGQGLHRPGFLGGDGLHQFVRGKGTLHMFVNVGDHHTEGKAHPGQKFLPAGGLGG